MFLPSERIFARESVATLVAQEVALLQVYLEKRQRNALRQLLVRIVFEAYALLVSHQVCLPNKSTIALFKLALVRLTSIRRMRLHMRLEVVGPLERNPANLARARGVFRSRVATLRLAP
jgi:hypothetical protein